MRISVIYESMYGNTGSIARAIAEGLMSHGEVSLLPVAPGVSTAADLLVLGGPTHAHGMSTAMSRKAIETAAEEAHRRGEPLEGSPTGGIRNLLEALPKGHGRPAASFDTRFDKSPLLTGSAARSIARRLESHGYRLVARPESFFVSDTEGPLLEGELERARAWGSSLLVLAGTLPGESCG
jgi:hypothetical protein